MLRRGVLSSDGQIKGGDGSATGITGARDWTLTVATEFKPGHPCAPCDRMLEEELSSGRGNIAAIHCFSTGSTPSWAGAAWGGHHDRETPYSDSGPETTVDDPARILV